MYFQTAKNCVNVKKIEGNEKPITLDVGQAKRTRVKGNVQNDCQAEIYNTNRVGVEQTRPMRMRPSGESLTRRIPFAGLLVAG